MKASVRLFYCSKPTERQRERQKDRDRQADRQRDMQKHSRVSQNQTQSNRSIIYMYLAVVY